MFFSGNKNQILNETFGQALQRRQSGSAYGNNFSNANEAFENISLQSLFRKSRISARQKEVANNYMVIKKIFGFSAVNSRISNTETTLLRQYGMRLLEETTSATMFRELETLIEWSKTGDILKGAFGTLRFGLSAAPPCLQGSDALIHVYTNVNFVREKSLLFFKFTS